MSNLAEEIKRVDNEILDHAEKIVELMKERGMEDKSTDVHFETITLWLKGGNIQVASICQNIETLTRKMKADEQA